MSRNLGGSNSPHRRLAAASLFLFGLILLAGLLLTIVETDAFRALPAWLQVFGQLPFVVPMLIVLMLVTRRILLEWRNGWPPENMKPKQPSVECRKRGFRIIPPLTPTVPPLPDRPIPAPAPQMEPEGLPIPSDAHGSSRRPKTRGGMRKRRQ